MIPLHGCFSRFLNCANGNKSRNAPHIKTYNNEDPKFIEQFLTSLHVDDLNSGSENIHDCYNLQAKTRLDQSSFNLRKFQLNSSDLKYMINGEVNHNSIVTKVLGLIWKKHKDNITFSFKNLVALVCPRPTQRQLLSFIASIYDPFGLINPFIFRLKVLFQMLCREKLMIY